MKLVFGPRKLLGCPRLTKRKKHIVLVDVLMHISTYAVLIKRHIDK